MIKIELNVPFTDLEGKEMLNPDNSKQIMAPLLANLIANSSGSQFNEPAKYMVWAYDLYKTGTMEFKESDKEPLLSFIRNNPYMSILAKDQIEKIIIEAK